MSLCFFIFPGEVCHSTFHVSRKTHVLVNDRLCHVYKIRRVLARRLYEPDMSISIFLESGHLVRHTWLKCPYMLHINPKQDVAELLSYVPELNALDARWRDDVQLMARFVEMRSDRLVDLRAAVRAQTNVTAVIRDYLYCLLLSKPVNVMDFTVKHFTELNGERCQYTVVSNSNPKH